MAKKKAPDEVDLHGMTVDEALARVCDFLDCSQRAHLHRVWIIHGKGTGALRNAVWDYISHRAGIMHYCQADPQRGGAGCIQVDLA